ncbi:MAG TPA: alpha/beta hydrolase [Motilibacterales bacterium]|nr:alpha/beta hydrolase [Motilibacterales bacterium]
MAINGRAAGEARAGGAAAWLRWAVTTLVASAVLALVGCSGADDAPADSPVASTPPTSAGEYLPGLAADVYVPVGSPQDGPIPVVLLVPGGGWQTADRSGLAPLAADLADAGFVAVNATYRAGVDRVTFPVPVQDVLCAAGFAVESARSAGLEPGPVVVLGHSAGGHLAALAALGADALAGQCPYAAPDIEALVGLAGVYDALSFEFALVDFFGGSPSEAPEAWRLGDPVGLVDSGQAPDDLQVLLLHGDSDVDVPLAQSEAFASSLRRAGVPVRLAVVPGATHASVYSAAVATPIVVEWIEGRSGPSP